MPAAHAPPPATGAAMMGRVMGTPKEYAMGNATSANTTFMITPPE